MAEVFIWILTWIGLGGVQFVGNVSPLAISTGNPVRRFQQRSIRSSSGKP